MISIPPSERDLHAYVDHALSDAQRHQVELYLQANPPIAAQVEAWQRDAQNLRSALNQDLLQPANPALDPTALRQHQRRQSRRHWASAAVLLIAVSVGGLGGWQARQMTQSSNLPMSDALAAHRMFAEQGFLPADFKVAQGSEMQGWIDRYFSHAERLPDLTGAGFLPVSSRLLSTDQGAAAMVLYEDGKGQQISFYIRPPGPQNNLLPRGNRRDGNLQADYWSGPGYNYAMVGPADGPAAKLLDTVGL